MGGRGASSNNGIVTATHITPSQNIESILRNGFDLSRAGSEAGDNWGDAVYFTTGELEKTFYSHRLGSKSYISASVDTSNMFKADLGTGSVQSPGDMYNRVVKQLPKEIQKEYQDYYKNVRKNQRVALAHTIAKHYTGLVLKEEQPKGLDPISGGNQIVVYDTSVIKKLKKKK